mgnify:FL=1
MTMRCTVDFELPGNGGVAGMAFIDQPEWPDFTRWMYQQATEQLQTLAHKVTLHPVERRFYRPTAEELEADHDGH